MTEPPAANTRPPPGTPEWESAVSRLHGALLSSRFPEIDRIPTTRNLFALPFEPLNLWGFATGRGRRLMEPSAAPGFYRAMARLGGGQRDRLLAFFHLNEPLPAPTVTELLAELAGAPDRQTLQRLAVVEHASDTGQLHCCLRFVPVRPLLQVADRFDRHNPDLAYIGRDSLYFAEELHRRLRGRHFGQGLDLCCGTGVQGLTIAQYCDSVVGTDINPRAAAFGNLNAKLNGLAKRARFAASNLAEGLDGPFDLVVANPPYVWMPPEEGKINLDGYGGELGLEVVERILRELDRLLGGGGEAHIVCDSPVLAGQSALVRLTERVMAGTKLGAVLTTVRYIYSRKRAAFLRAQGASHVVYYYLVIGRQLPPGVRVVELPPLKRLAYAAYVRLARRIYAS